MSNGLTGDTAEPQVFPLAGRARGGLTAVVFESPLAVPGVAMRPVHGYVLKRPHRGGEPEASRRASELDLGPRLIWADDHLIIEEYLPRDSQVTESVHVGERLAPRLAYKFMVMLEHNLFHALDDLPNHLYVIKTVSHGDPRFIDWGRAKVLPSSFSDQERFLIEGLRTFAELVARFGGGPRGYRDFVRTLGGSGASRHELRRLLAIVESNLSSAQGQFLGERQRAERWTQFFATAKQGDGRQGE